MNTVTTWTDDHFIAGDVALDFANTVYRRTPEPGPDLLGDAGALATWLARAGLLPTTGEPRDILHDPDAALRQARTLRELLWAIFDAQRNGRELPAQALAGLLDIARRGARGVAVNSDGSIIPLTAEGACATLALRGIKLALSPPSQRVRACDGCGWFFVDTSRGRRRRWCSMKTCGNQSKAARYRSAHR
ncbi:CGNR zinc finger domain-containing protein [Nonomuraea jiangxiensis]|uniref:Conserved protein containing a Zn-ribbon-like motif, possibly RNA-binding n=1 Tax=Nonomuraea jiangxiensis TaxID=633440 RepID=A0A1G8Q7I1_9ACTN|nr:ABATE domain-containing protein [Nonomuraea jiangxiensis]SDJ00651.1 Conserved protein containing a Zn-ribbon-like motif, possibly RNA-binding [Nonomuraea jiangxiensis]